MILKSFTIRDSKTQFFGQPWFMRSHGEAERTFAKLAKDPKSDISNFPEDYDLYHLGEFDDQTGKFELLDTPQHLMKAVNAIPKD